MFNLSLIGFRVQNQKPRKNNFPTFPVTYVYLLVSFPLFPMKGLVGPCFLLNFSTVRRVHAFSEFCNVWF
ncbi:hypothetical protein JHK86_026612 [Glycine max]|nr:hypothetical protein JHK86_026612 [Glycine max]